VQPNPPLFLAVCRSSREYALSIYTASVETLGFDYKIRLRPKMDTLVLYDYDGGQTRRYFKAKEVGTFSDISVIALYERLHESSMIVPRSQRIEGILEIFPKVEKLLVFPVFEDLAFLKSFIFQGQECFIRPVLDGDHIRSYEARGVLGCYIATVKELKSERESLQTVIQKVQRLHAAKGNEQSEVAEDRLIEVEFVCVCLGALNLKTVHSSSKQDLNVGFGELA
jgi:hypothetical protein